MSAQNELIDSYYRAWFRFHPEAAVYLGVEGYGHLLTPYGDDDIGALIALNEKLIDAVDELNESGLDEDQQIDMHIMHGAALIEGQQLIESDWRIKDPTRFIPVDAIYQLTIRPVKDRCEAIQRRLKDIPGYLRGAKAHLKTAPENIPAIWLESAITEAEEGIHYLRQLEHHPLLSECRIHKEIEDATHALDEFLRFMNKDLLPKAAGEFACGRHLFELKLKHLHGLDVSADQLYKLGESLYESTWQQLIEVTRKLQGDDNVATLTEKIQKQYAPDKNLLETYKNTMHAAFDFVNTHDLVSLPETQYLHVIETPNFMQHQIPFAAYMEPMPTDVAQTAYYYVTPPKDQASLGEHNTLSLQHTCVHEAWPGHHLQFVTANLTERSRSLPRLVNPSASLYEGWALYCEQLMFEQGFLAEPESEFVLLKDRLWRALRIMIDVDLQVNKKSVSECAKLMQEKLGFSEAQAMGELSWYSQAPTVPMGYGTGWLLINETRNRLQAADNQFSLKAFHDQLLSSGSIGLPWVIQRNFGKPIWNSVRDSVISS